MTAAETGSAALRRILSRYQCPRCGIDWEGAWDSACDDDCPSCGARHVSPCDWDEIDERDPLQLAVEESVEETGNG